MAYSLIIIDEDLVVGLWDQLVMLLAPQLIFELLCVEKLCCLVVLNFEESWVGNRFRRRQKFALILKILSIGNSWRVGLFILYTIYHLVKVEWHGQFLSWFSISVYDEKVSFFILGPQTTLLQVAGVNTRSSFEWHSEQLKEVVVVFCAELKLLADRVQICTLVCCDHDDLAVLADFDDRKILPAH